MIIKNKYILNKNKKLLLEIKKENYKLNKNNLYSMIKKINYIS
jgi:hypothetical protein